MTNPLLDLLNRAGTRSSPGAGASAASSTSPAPQAKADAIQAQSDGKSLGPQASPEHGAASPTSQAHASRSTASSVTNASSLLQNLLNGPISPRAAKPQHQPAGAGSTQHPEPHATQDTSQPQQQPQQQSDQDDTAKLLGLLSPTASAGQAVSSGAVVRPHAERGPHSSFHFQSPFDELLSRPQATAGADSGAYRAKSTAGSPAQSASNLVPPSQENVSPSQQNGASSSVDITSPDGPQASEPAAPSPVQAAAVTGNGTTTTAQDTGLVRKNVSPAFTHVAKLRQESTFGSSHTSGLTIQSVSSDTDLLSLDCQSAQPGGVASLHPAKLEMSPLAMLTIPFKQYTMPIANGAGETIAQLPLPQAVNLGQDVIAYPMKKGRVRVLHSETGDRAMLQVPDGSHVRSIAASAGVQTSSEGKATEWYLSASSEPKSGKGTNGLTIWKVTLTTDQLEEQLITSVAEADSVFVACHWNVTPSKTPTLAFVARTEKPTSAVCSILSDFGSGSRFKVDMSLDQVEKAADRSFNAGSDTVASAISADGSVFASLSKGLGDGEYILDLHAAKGKSTSLAVDKLPQQAIGDSSPTVSYLALIGPSPDGAGTSEDAHCPRAALIGFNSNKVLGLYDMQHKQWRNIWRFDAPHHNDVESFNVVEYNQNTSTIFVASSARASLFAISLKFANLAQQGSVGLVERVASHWPATLPWTVQVSRLVREYALPEPLVSFAIAADSDVVQNGAKVFGRFALGTQTVLLPPFSDEVEYLPLWKEPEPQTEAEDSPAPAVRRAPAPPASSNRFANDFTSSDSDFDTARFFSKPVFKKQKSARDIRQDDAPAEWDDRLSVSQMLSSEASAPASPATKSAGILRRPDTSSPKPDTPQPKKSKKNRATAGEERSASRSREVASPVKTELVKQPIVKTHEKPNNDKPAAAALDGAVASGDQVTNLALRQAITSLESKLDQLKLNPPATSAPPPASSSSSSGHLSASALSAIASEVSAAVSGDVSHMLNASLLESVREGIENALRKVSVQTLPNELSKVMTQPAISAALTKSITQGIVPTVQKTAMDVVSKVIAPHFEETILTLTQSVEERIDRNLAEVRKTIVAEQSTALKTTQQQLHDVTQVLTSFASRFDALQQQNEALHATLKEVKQQQTSISHDPSSRMTPRPPSAASYQYQPPSQHPHLHAYDPHAASPWPTFERVQSPYQFRRPTTAQQPFGAEMMVPATPSAHGMAPIGTPTSFNFGMGQPGAPVSAPFSAAPPPPATPSPLVATDDKIEDALIGALSATDGTSASQVAEVLSRLQQQYKRPNLALTCGDGENNLAVSQAVLLTLVHRLASLTSSNRISLEIAIPWAEASLAYLNPDDGKIADPYAKVSGDIRRDFEKAWQLAATTTSGGGASWWTRDRLEMYLLRYLR
ncbi:unnamed protein product [Sympodiomycopsis kandeliae]